MDKYNYFCQKALLYFIPIILIVDFVTKFIIFKDYNIPQISSYTKLFIEILLLLFIFNNFKKTSKDLLFLFLLSVIFLIGQILNAIISGYNLNDLYYNLYTHNAFLFSPFFAIVLKNTNNYHIVIKKNIDFLKKISLINMVFILLGFFLEIEIFKSYPLTERFGYNGLLSSSSSASYFFIASILVFYIDYFHSKDKKTLLILLINILASLFVGTKTIWFFLLLLILIHFCFLVSKKALIINRAIVLLLLSIIVILKEKIKLFIVSLFNFGQKIYDEHGFITVITSTRDLYLKKVIAYYSENASFNNFLFGGFNVFDIRVEFEFINLFVFYGLIGFLTYIYILKTLYKNVLKSFPIISIFIAVIITVSLSGGFFYSVFSSIVIYLAFQYFHIKNKQFKSDKF